MSQSIVVSTFDLLVLDSFESMLAAQSATCDRNRRREITSSILNVVFSIEHLANNCITSLELQHDIDYRVDKFTAMEKLIFFLELKKGSRIFDKGCKEVQRIQQLFALRNDYVHPKVKTRSLDEHQHLVYENIRIPKNPYKWESVHAKAAFDALIDFLKKYLVEWCKLSPRQIHWLVRSRMIGGEADSSDSSGIEVALIRSDHKKLFADLKTYLKTDLGFLGFLDQK